MRSARIVPMRPLKKDFEVLSGDPEVAGKPFVMRIRELPGSAIPPHTHPIDEHITVVQGTLLFAVSETVDRALMQELKPGAYVFIPKGATMFGASPDGAVVQVHGIGPFHIHWRGGFASLDQPDADKVFRFRRGDRVSTPRGNGTVHEGYASGDIVQYEIDPGDGNLFMADEADTRLSAASGPR